MEVDQVAATSSLLPQTSANHGAAQQNNVEQSLPFVEKYRPASLGDIISHTEIVQTSKSFEKNLLTFIFYIVRKFIDAKNMPHLLFYGPPGTGKTSCMLAIAKEIYGPKNYKHMTLELNASDDRGINVVRDQIKSFCSTQ